MTPALTDQQKADAAYVESLSTSGKRLRLDFSDERQYRHAVLMHTLGGQTPDKYPGLHQGLAEAREAHIAAGGPPPLEGPDTQGFETGGVVASISTLEGTQTTASEGFSSVLGGAYMLANTIVVKDANMNVLARGSDAQYADGTYLGVATSPEGALQVTDSMSSILQYSYQKEQGQPPVTEHYELKAKLTPMADPIVEAPKKTQSIGENIRIGLGRGNGSTKDVDYWFWQKEENTTYAIPLEGYADFNGNVKSILSVYGYLGRGESTPAPDPGPKGGVLEFTPQQVAFIEKNCEISGRRLKWTMPPATSETDNGRPLVFVPAPWDTSEATFLFLQFKVNIENQALPAVATILSSKKKDSDPMDGTTTILPIEFVFHCIAADSEITLADGSTEAIQKLTTEHSVRDSNGEARPVVSTVIGNHDGPVLRLTVDSERELLLSHNHLVITPEGPIPARELAVGDVVCVDGGTAPLAGIAEEQYTGLLCNASFSVSGEPTDPGRNALLANGILVGDYELQVQTYRARREDPEWVLAQLDPVYHEDYRNHMAAMS